mmetsp:Transcript_94360/g.177606  ORF Transcript_94360/g.177606 Transcript_94360/m.177606 type:complete len:401 (+) Transcript_94360:60-1262(+)
MAPWQHGILATVLALTIQTSTSPYSGESKDEEDSFSLVQVAQVTRARSQLAPSSALSPAEAKAATSRAASGNAGDVQMSGRGGWFRPSIVVTPYMLRRLVRVLVLISACVALYLGATWQWSRGYMKEQNITAASKTPAIGEKATAANSGADSKAKAKTITQNLFAKLGLHRCLTGVGKMLNVKNQPRDNSETCSAPLAGSGAESQPDAGLSLPDRSPAEVCMEGGHPNFSGTWTCIEVEGDPESLLQDFGCAYYERSVASAVGFGVGRASRTYSHKGSHLDLKENGLYTREQEWDISGEEQQTKDALVKPYWDRALPSVLVIESMDLLKEKPSTWSTTRQYFIDKDTLALDVSSQSGCVARWVWQRDTAVLNSNGDAATDTTVSDAAPDLVDDTAKSSQQ